MKRLGVFCGCLAFGILAKTSEAQLPSIATGSLSVEVQAVATGLSAPLDLVSANDGSGRLFIIEQAGRVRILKNGALNPTPFLDISAQIKSGGEEGLLGIAFHPGYSDSSSPGFRKFYTYANEPNNGAGPDFTVPMTGAPASQIVIAEWQASSGNADLADPSSKRAVLRANHPQSNHNGGKIAFRPSDGFLYIAIGDGGSGGDVGDGHTANIGNGQDITNVLGKILRIDPLQPSLTGGSTNPISANGKYRNPSNNPFVNANGLDEIYAYGFRNPFRFSFDAATDRFIVGDVGQGNIEEVDLVELGKNYGWNRKEGTFLYNTSTGGISVDTNPNPAFTNPILEYDHGDGISVIGGFVYRGAAIPSLMGKYVFADYLFPTLGAGRLFYSDITSGVIQELRLGINSRSLGLVIKGFGTDAAGEIYLMADNSNNTAGQVLKLVAIPAVPELLNLSTRARIEANDNDIAIAGFILTGSAPKTVVLRALGPSLNVNGQPFAGRLSNPSLGLLDGKGTPLISNDDWMTGPRQQELINFGFAPSNSLESAIVATLDPGAYTAVARGVDGATGIALVELYDVTQNVAGNAINISTRGRVQTGDNVMIAGFIIGGSQTQRVIVRALGPSLTASGVTSVLQNPTLDLVDSSGTIIASNDNWRSTQQSEITATGLAPTNDAESAIVRTLNPGNYTAIVRGVSSASGVALVEVYRLSP